MYSSSILSAGVVRTLFFAFPVDAGRSGTSGTSCSQGGAGMVGGTESSSSEDNTAPATVAPVAETLAVALAEERVVAVTVAVVEGFFF